MIVAVSENHCIGKNNDLPWKLPTDLKHFKAITTDKVVVMGRKCYDSIGRPLPNRTNVVISRDKTLKIPGCVVFDSLKKALNAYESKEVFIIGGAEIYKLGAQYAGEFYVTKIMANVDGDVFLDESIFKDWLMVETEGPFNEDGFDFRFDRYARKELIYGKKTDN